MRKCVSFLLVTVLILTMTVSSRAVKNDEFSSGLDTKVELYTPESFRSIFLNDEGMVRAMLETEEITEIEYHYTFAKQIDNPELADVFLTFVMMVGNVEYTVDVVGTVNSYVLSSGDILWDGPIRGNVCVNNTVYKVIASFSKLESNTDIQVTATVQALNAEDAIEPLIFFVW